MFIKEAIKLAPFSRKLPCILPFPGSSYFLRVEASHVGLFDGKGEEVQREELSLHLPLKEISTHLDIERECVVIQGKDDKGSFRKKFSLVKGKLVEGGKTPWKKGEKLTFGCHKKQEAEYLLLKADVLCCLPHLFSLGARAPLAADLSFAAQEFADLITRKDKLTLIPWLQRCLQQRCEGIFFPSMRISQSYAIAETSLALWAELYPLLRSLFVRIEENVITFLPLLPPECHAGKMTEISLGEVGKVHFMWSKKSMFKALLSIEKPCSYIVETATCEKRFFLRFGIRGERRQVQVGEKIEFLMPGLYFLDRWER